MPGKEEVAVCIDNSEYMRNGDYNPNRMTSQMDAVNLLVSSKIQQHPETTVSLITMANRSPRVDIAPTTDLGKLLATISSINIKGSSNFTTSIKVAKLALRKRTTEQGSVPRRIIIFVGSPLNESKEDLEKLGKELKKINIAVDVVNFGEESLNTEKLDSFVNSVNTEDNNSNLLTVPPGPHVLADMIAPIVLGKRDITSGGSDETAATSSDSFAEYGGINPEVDPDLAFAMKMSMDEEKRRQEKLKEESGGAKKTEESSSVSASASKASEQSTTKPSNEDDVDMDDDEEMKLALQMSLEENQSKGKESKKGDKTDTMNDDDEDMDDDELLKKALLMSEEQPNKENINDVLEDQDYLKSVIGNIEGVEVDEVLKDVKKDTKKDDKKKDDDEKME